VDHVGASHDASSQLHVHVRERRVVREDVVRRPDDAPARRPERVERVEEGLDALSAVVFGRGATKHAGQPMQVQDDADVVGPQRNERRQRDRIVEVGQAVHADRHEPGFLEAAGEQGLERVLGIEWPGRHDHRSVVAGGADARDPLGGVG